VPTADGEGCHAAKTLPNDYMVRTAICSRVLPKPPSRASRTWRVGGAASCREECRILPGEAWIELHFVGVRNS
jgi:hypothetical protein